VRTYLAASFAISEIGFAHSWRVHVLIFNLMWGAIANECGEAGQVVAQASRANIQEGFIA
jgi:hypothetical protein